MSTQISAIYDAIYARVISLLTNHKELRNPRLISANDSLFLTQGLGINLGAVTNTNRELACRLSLQRQLVITNTLAVNATERNVTIRKNAEKQLLEDQLIVLKNFEGDPTLSGVTDSIRFLFDNGIEEVFAESGNFIMIQSTFDFEYFIPL